MEGQINHTVENKKPNGTVGIMTFHWAANYGAVLQTWALQRFLQQQNYRTEIIDFVPDNHQIKLLRCFKTKHLSTMKLRIKEYKKERLIQEFRETRLNVSTIRYSTKEQLTKNPPNYDYYISGSDQIWNPYFTMNGQHGVTLSYYLDFAPTHKHRIAFSSSFGCKALPENVVQMIKPELAKFDALSIREAEGVTILESMGFSGVNTADPTLLLSSEDYQGIINKPKSSERTIYAYILHGQKSVAVPLVDCTQKILNCTVNEEDELTVEDWLQHIRDASFVVTNSFHCVVFCLLFHTPFYAIDVEGKDMSSRITTLLRKVGLEHRFLALPINVNSVDLETINDIDWELIDTKIEIIREHACKYLLDAISKRDRVDDIPQSRCTGCGLCSVLCPKNCIEMQENEQGFIFPRIDESACIHCGLCVKRCTAFSERSRSNPAPKAYACWNLDETVRNESSSGGLFTALAQGTIDSSGVVYGAKYVESLTVEHCPAMAIDSLKELRGSKYQPSKAWVTFKQIKQNLDTGKKVLFAGTPCQIVALKKYIGNNEGLICIDIACHGVPSLKVLRDKCKSVSSGTVTRVDFRNKRSGWKDYSCIYYDADGKELHSEIGTESDFMRGYIDNLYIRESCEDCQFAAIPRVGDISLADCWTKAHDGSDLDNKGITAVLINTEKGERLFNDVRDKLHTEDISLEAVLKGTPTLAKGSSHTNNRARFWYQYNREGYNTVMRHFFQKAILKRKLLLMAKKLGRG